jgi:hypothetical protein
VSAPSNQSRSCSSCRRGALGEQLCLGTDVTLFKVPNQFIDATEFQIAPVDQSDLQAHADRERRLPPRSLRALAQRVEVDEKELRIMGSKSVLLRTLVAAESAKTAGFGVPSSVCQWRATADEDGNYCFAVAL